MLKTPLGTKTSLRNVHICITKRKASKKELLHGNKLIVANYPCAFFGRRNKLRNFAHAFQKQPFL